jgi:O-antigen ligase
MIPLNQSINSNEKIFTILTILLFSFLPISFIFGNSTVNFNIILLSILLLTYCFNYNKWKWLKDDLFLSLLLLYSYLVFNSFLAHYRGFSIDYNGIDKVPDGIIRSLTFIKFILLVYAFKILIFNYEILERIIKIWLLITLIFIFDIFFETIVGKNILGYVSPDGTRIVSFFKDEMVVGGFIYFFGFVVGSFYLSKNNDIYKKFFFILFLILIPVSVFVTGERSNFIKSSVLFLLIIIFINNHKLFFNKKLIFISLIAAICLLFTFNVKSNTTYTEFLSRIKVDFTNKHPLKKFGTIKYLSHYDASIKIFKNYPLLGVGNKNFRIECRKDKYFNQNIMFSKNRCSTHPHQVHFELLSEHGLIGYFIILFILIRFVIRNIYLYRINGDNFNLNCIFILSLFFVPLLPGSGIFGTFNGTLFWIVFSLSNLRLKKE